MPTDVPKPPPRAAARGRRRLARVAVLAIVGVLLAPASAAERREHGRDRPKQVRERDRPGPFAQHRMRVSGSAGTEGTRSVRYVTLGAGFGYYVVDGLEIGLNTRFWLGGEPFIWQLTPNARYVFHFVPIVKPYIGPLYKYGFIEAPAENQHALGGSAGLFFVTGSRVFFGAGVAYEHYLDCDEDCWAIYPDFVISVSF